MKSVRYLLLVALVAAPLPALGQDASDSIAERLAAFEAKELSEDDLLAELERYGPRALDPLRRCVEGDGIQHRTREWVLEHLPRIAPDGEAVLRLLVHSPNERVGPAALQALGKAGTYESVQPLLPLLASKDLPTCMRTARALTDIVDRERTGPAGFQPRVRESLLAAIRRLLNPAFADPEHVDGVPPAVHVLTRLFVLDAEGPLQECLQAPNVRPLALSSLLDDALHPRHHPDKDAVFADLRETLYLLLDDLQDERELQTVIKALGNIGDLASLGQLLAFMEEHSDDPDSYTKFVIHSAQRLSGERFTRIEAWQSYWLEAEPVFTNYEALLDNLLSGTDPQRLSALRHLPKIRDRRLAPALDELLLGDALPSELVVLAAVECLGHQQERAGVATLIGLLELPTSTPAMKRQATWALGRIAGRPGPQNPTYWRGVFPDAERPAGDPRGSVEEPVDLAALGLDRWSGADSGEGGMAAGASGSFASSSERGAKAPDANHTAAVDPVGEEGGNGFFLGLVTVLIVVLLVALDRRRVVPAVPPTARTARPEFKAPTVEDVIRAQHAESKRSSDRLERLKEEVSLRRELEHSAPELGDTAVLSGLQAALLSFEPESKGSRLGPELLGCVEELLELHKSLDADDLDDAGFTLWEERLTATETSLGTALNEVREYSFLLKQLAHCRRTDRPFSAEAAERCIALQEELETKFDLDIESGEDMRTMDVEAVFDWSDSGPTRADLNQEDATLDVTAVFGDETAAQAEPLAELESEPNRQLPFETVDTDTLFDHTSGQ